MSLVLAIATVVLWYKMLLSIFVLTFGTLGQFTVDYQFRSMHESAVLSGFIRSGESGRKVIKFKEVREKGQGVSGKVWGQILQQFFRSSTSSSMLM